MKRSRRVRGNEFDHHLGRIRHHRSPVGVALLQDSCDDGAPCRPRQENVDEPRAGNLRTLHPRRLSERGDKRSRELAWVALERLGELQRDVARVIAWPALCRPLEHKMFRSVVGRNTPQSGAKPLDELRFKIGQGSSSEDALDKGGGLYRPCTRASSGKAEGTHVERPANAAFREPFDLNPPSRKKILHRTAIVALHQYLRALEAGTPRQRRRNRRVDRAPQAAFCCKRAAFVRCSAEKTHEAFGRFTLSAEKGEVRRWRKRQGLAFSKERARVAVVVVPHQGLVERVIGKIGMHLHFASVLAAPRAASDLFQQREQTLGCAKLGAVQRVVRPQYADQRQLRKIVTLCQHLRADQDVGLPPSDRIAHRLEGSFARGTVAVDSQHAGSWMEDRESALESLRAESKRQQVDIP